MTRRYVPQWCSPILPVVVGLVCASCVALLVVRRGHYTIDVLVAYFATTGFFWLYHVLADNEHLRRQQNGLTLYCWLPPLVAFFESDSPRVALVNEFDVRAPTRQFLRALRRRLDGHGSDDMRPRVPVDSGHETRLVPWPLPTTTSDSSDRLVSETPFTDAPSPPPSPPSATT